MSDHPSPEEYSRFSQSRIGEMLEVSRQRKDTDAVIAQVLAGTLLLCYKVEETVLRDKLTQGAMLLVQGFCEGNPTRMDRICNAAIIATQNMAADNTDILTGRL